MKMAHTLNTTTNIVHYNRDNRDYNRSDNRDKYGNSPMNKPQISMDNIKYDLLKIAEPYDGIMYEGSGYLIVDLFHAYLTDLQRDRLIYGYDLPEEQYKENSVTFDALIQLTEDRSPKKLKIHVGVYKSAWNKPHVAVPASWKR
jgi:hypothetical protein